MSLDKPNLNKRKKNLNYSNFSQEKERAGDFSNMKKAKGNLDDLYRKVLNDKFKINKKLSYANKIKIGFTKKRKKNRKYFTDIISNQLDKNNKIKKNNNFKNRKVYDLQKVKNNDFSFKPRKVSEENNFQTKSTNQNKSKQKTTSIFFWLGEIYFSIARIFNFQGKQKKVLVSFLIFGLLLIGTGYYYQASKIKGRVLGISDKAYQETLSGIDNLKQQRFLEAQQKLETASNNYQKAELEISKLGKPIIYLSQYIPYLSRLYSGYNLLQAGKEISQAGKESTLLIENINQIKNNQNQENISWLDFLQKINNYSKKINEHVKKANYFLNQVKINDVSTEKQVKIIKIKKLLENWQGLNSDFIKNNFILVDLLGGNGPRKYLFLFENNQEIRATGGFIGSYGLLSMKNGKMEKFFVDGIFNPDGQLKENIVPPRPIQKISSAWSLHDSNWWPDFPKSAEKAISFYEKTGGPTTDGVVAITPEVLKEILSVTGPIYLSQYDAYISKNNFIEILQSEVEENYNKNKNHPKKILADLTQAILEKIFQKNNYKEILGIFQSLENSLNEKNILIYSRNKNLEKIIKQKGWGGEIKNISKDYLMVVNTNINGYKTDGVIKEKIEHQAQINEDGSIIDDVVIIREHQGGNTPYEWWNKVNVDYIRVYVPLGSKLLLAEGQTREKIKSPLNYQKEKFKIDPDIAKEEANIKIDPDSGTRIYKDSGKTVFANWTYVSPGEKVVLHYRYQLPFSIDLTDNNDYYSLLVQKQAGSQNDIFNSKIIYPQSWQLKWKSPELKTKSQKLILDGRLKKDTFFGCLWEKIND